MLYTAVIRSAVAYGAAAYHVPAAPKPRGIARSLAREQNRCLRVIAGAFRATPVRNLETETFVPPIDLYLNVRLADFEARLQLTGKAQLIDNVCAGAGVRAQLRRRRGRPRKQKQPTIEEGAGKLRWAKERMWDGTRGALYEAREALARDWRERWQSDCAAARRRRRRPHGGRVSPADRTPEFGEGKSLERHEGLRKHESSVLIQMRTGKIGLRAFLHQRRVPDVLTPSCGCGAAPETPEHLLLSCRETVGERRELPELRTRRDYEAQIDNPATAGSLARWLLRLGRLHQFDLAESLRRGEEAAGARGEAGSRGGQGLH